MSKFDIVATLLLIIISDHSALSTGHTSSRCPSPPKSTKAIGLLPTINAGLGCALHNVQYNAECILQNVKHNIIHCIMLCVIHCSLIQFHMLTVMWRCNIWCWKVVPMTSRPVGARLVLKLYFGLKIPTVWTTQTPVGLLMTISLVVEYASRRLIPMSRCMVI